MVTKATSDVLADGAVTPPKLASLGKNILINGNFRVWQRGSSLNPTVGAVSFTTDRWYMFQAGGSTGHYTVAKAGDQTKYAVAISANASGPSGVQRFAQVIESNTAGLLAGKTVTLSFTAYCSATWNQNPAVYLITGTGSDQGGLSLENGTWTGMVSAISVASLSPTINTTPQRYTYTVTLGAAVKEIGVKFQWEGSGVPAGATMYIYDVQLEGGSAASDIEIIPYGDELNRSQRYHINYSGGQGGNGLIFRAPVAGTNFWWVPFPVIMRAIPTIALNPLSAGGLTSSGAVNVSPGGFELMASAPGVGSYDFFQWTASAEL
jgi:hypothetical protein